MAVASSIIFNLALLLFFKYWDFLAGSLQAMGLTFMPVLNIHLPIGISFYTFQTMSYTIDVYRKDAPVQRNMVDFGAFVTMFPQLIAGPIVQYKTVAADLRHRLHTSENFALGARRFCVGLAKKVLLANSIGALWEDCLAAQGAGTLTVLGAGWASPPMASRSTSISPATPTWPSAWGGSSASGSTRTLTTPTAPTPWAPSGGGGTCP